jgi:CDP-diacylglycerol---serine O-phosphatidyltransferase
MAGAGVTLAVVLLAYGEFGFAFVPGAFALAAAASLRLSYFNVYGLAPGSTRYVGLPTDQSIIIFAAVMLLDGSLSQGSFQVAIYGTAIVLVAAMVSPLRIPKFMGAWFWALNGFALLIAVLHALRLIF